MNINYIARQPILDLKLNTWGYELLFRAGAENSFLNSENRYDGDTATMSVINNALLDNIHNLSLGVMSLINFTRGLILDEYALLLNRSNTIIEILETVVPDTEVVYACKKLKDKGYILALDDFFFREEYHELLILADIVKIDFIAAKREEIVELVARLKPYNVKLLAEKIENYDDFEFAKDLGCILFQGYFFSKPVMVRRDHIQESKLAKLHLLGEVNSKMFDIDKIEEIIKSDPVLTLRLLRYLNSAFFGLRNEVKNIHHAIVMLGPKKLRRWITVVISADLSEGKPLELLKESLFRAKFCELLGENATGVEREEDFFLLGLLSHIDAFFGQPKDVLLDNLPISKHIKGVLVGLDECSLLHDSLEIAQALGLGMWDYVDNISQKNNIDGSLIKSSYFSAVNHANDYIAMVPKE